MQIRMTDKILSRLTPLPEFLHGNKSSQTESVQFVIHDFWLVISI